MKRIPLKQILGMVNKMKYRTIILIAFVNFILSSTLLQLFRINDALPNFCIILSIVIAALSNDKNAYIFAAFSGVFQDFFLGRMLGVNFLLYVLIVMMTLYLIEIMFKGNFLTPLFLIAFGTLFYHFSFYIIMFFVQSTIPLSMMLTKIITEVFYNMFLGYWIYAFVFKRVHGYKLGDFNA